MKRRSFFTTALALIPGGAAVAAFSQRRPQPDVDWGAPRADSVCVVPAADYYVHLRVSRAWVKRHGWQSAANACCEEMSKLLRWSYEATGTGLPADWKRRYAFAIPQELIERAWAWMRFRPEAPSPYPPEDFWRGTKVIPTNRVSADGRDFYLYLAKRDTLWYSCRPS